MRSFFPLLALSGLAQALYFYIDGVTPRCFFEELPKDTLVVGDYTAEEWDEQQRAWVSHEGITIYISVDVSLPLASIPSPLRRRSNVFSLLVFFFSFLLLGKAAKLCSRALSQETNIPISPLLQEVFDNDHRVVSQRGSRSGRFTFTAADAGDHKLCFTPSSSSGRNGWLSVNNANGGIRLNLDLAIGETSQLESTDKNKIEDIASRIKDLNARLNDVRREQVFQRVSQGCFVMQPTEPTVRLLRNGANLLIPPVL